MNDLSISLLSCNLEMRTGARSTKLGLRGAGSETGEKKTRKSRLLSHCSVKLRSAGFILQWTIIYDACPFYINVPTNIAIKPILTRPRALKVGNNVTETVNIDVQHPVYTYIFRAVFTL